MRNPLWVLNISLVFIFLAVSGIVFLLKYSVPERVSLIVQAEPVVDRPVISPVDIRRIYENDIFKTYVAPMITEPIEAPEEVNLQLPTAPAPKYPPRIEPQRVTFLDPLKIVVKGIINSSDLASTKAVIADDKSREEKLYIVGDTIEDAEIIRIDRNKVIFVRANGQQETVFLSVIEAQNDILFDHKVDWSQVIKKQADDQYGIESDLFVKRISNVAQFIDSLDMTTAFEREAPIGLKIGLLEQNSVGQALGLFNGDIILSINGLSVKERDDRVAAYQHVSKLKPGSAIRLVVKRGSNTREILYHLYDSSHDLDLNSLDLNNQKLTTSNMHMQMPITTRVFPDQKLQPKSEFAAPPVYLDTLKSHDKAAMKQFGGRGALLERKAHEKKST